MNTMTAMMAAQMTTVMHVMTGRLKEERGASALEYVGMILVAALVVGGVWTAVNGNDIPGKVSTAISEILGGGGGEGGGEGG